MTNQSGSGAQGLPVGGVLSGTLPSPAFATNGTTALLGYVTNALSANVTTTTANQFYDGPTCTVTIGTWFVYTTLIANNPTIGNHMSLKLWDGTTAIGNGWFAQTTAGVSGQLTASGIYVATGNATLRASVASDNAGGTIFAAAPVAPSGNVASTITAIRIA